MATIAAPRHKSGYGVPRSPVGCHGVFHPGAHQARQHTSRSSIAWPQTELQRSVACASRPARALNHGRLLSISAIRQIGTSNKARPIWTRSWPIRQADAGVGELAVLEIFAGLHVRQHFSNHAARMHDRPPGPIQRRQKHDRAVGRRIHDWRFSEIIVTVHMRNFSNRQEARPLLVNCP